MIRNRPTIRCKSLHWLIIQQRAFTKASKHLKMSFSRLLCPPLLLTDIFPPGSLFQAQVHLEKSKSSNENLFPESRIKLRRTFSRIRYLSSPLLFLYHFPPNLISPLSPILPCSVSLSRIFKSSTPQQISPQIWEPSSNRFEGEKERVGSI